MALAVSRLISGVPNPFSSKQQQQSGKVVPPHPQQRQKPSFGHPGHAASLGIGKGPQIKPNFAIYKHPRRSGVRGVDYDIPKGGGVSAPAMAHERQRRLREANETRGKGEHFGKHTGHTQIIHPTNAATSNQPRTDHGKTDFLSSSGGNPAKPNHRPLNRQRGVYPITKLDARAMVSQDGGLKLAKQHKS